MCSLRLHDSQFNTIVDIELHKWAESHQLSSLCTDVGMATMFNQLHNKMESIQVGVAPGLKWSH